MKKQTEESFWDKVEINSLDKCWPYTGAHNNTGYGTIGWHGVTHCAHRIAAWLLGFVEYPNAPKDKTGTGFILHSCDNPSCCNPTHWDIGTYTTNQLDAYKRGRRAQPAGESHTNAKLTNKQAADIRNRYRDGVYQKELAKLFGVSQRVISLVTRGETYQCSL